MFAKERAQREVVLAVFFIAAAIVFTWPLARVFRSGVSDLGDPLLNIWIVDWVQYGLLHQPLHLFDAPIFHPAKYPLAYSENMIAVALAMMPFRLLGFAPLTVFNFAMLLGFAFSAYGASVLARTAGASTFAAIVTGLGYGFCQFFFDHLPHLQIIWAGWLPLILAGLLRYWRTPAWRNAALAAAVFLANGLTNVYFLLFVSVAVFGTLLLLFTAGPVRPFRDWFRLGVAFVLAGILLYPVLSPYRTVAALYEMRRGPGEVISGSATAADWFSSTGRSALYGDIELPGDHGERRLFPGVVPIAMSLLTLVLVPFVVQEATDRRRITRAIHILDVAITAVAVARWGAIIMQKKFQLRMAGHLIVSVESTPNLLFLLVLLIFLRCAIRIPRIVTGGREIALRDFVARSRFPIALWCGALWVFIGVSGSLGANGWLHMFLYEHVYPFQSLRAVGRWAVIAYVGIIPWSAAGIDIATRHSKRLFVSAIIALAVIGDVSTRLRWERVQAEPAPLYRWMAGNNVEGPFLELPMDDENAAYKYALASTHHHRMLMNGTSGFEPKLHMTLRDMTQRLEFNDVLQSLLETNRCRYVVIHGDGYSDRTVLASWIRGGIASGKLAFVNRFDHGVEGDYVLAVNQHIPSADARPLEQYLNHQPVRNASTFGVIERPAMMATIFQRLEVEGWALSPAGIQKVEVEIQAGKQRFPARMVARPEINARFPWYGNRPSGYIAAIPKRPKGFPRDTDLQVVITDGAGKETLLRDILITWH